MLVLADLQADNQILSLGTTNLDTQAIEMLTDADIRLVSNQVDLLPVLCTCCNKCRMSCTHGGTKRLLDILQHFSRLKSGAQSKSQMLHEGFRRLETC